METISIKDRGGADVYLTSLDVVVCPICDRSTNIAVVVIHTEAVYNGSGIHWSSCGCRWYSELGKVSDVHRTVLDEGLKVKSEISTVQGRAGFVKTEVEDEQGNWNDSYYTHAGYYVIHEGKRHHVYKVIK